jgi:hypothetical protein
MKFRPRIIQQFPKSRGLFTRASVGSLVLCVFSAVAYLATMDVKIFMPYPGLVVSAKAWIGWLCISFAAATFLLLMKRGSEVRRADERIRSGLCPKCGYDLRASNGKCPECGTDVEAD